MTVRVKLHAILRKFLPPGSQDNTAVLEVPEGSTVSEVVAQLGIPPKHAGMLVCGDEYLEPGSSLREGQEFSIFPPIAGGSRGQSPFSSREKGDCPFSYLTEPCPLFSSVA
jgi:molybdopterin converting factor small subunit